MSLRAIVDRFHFVATAHSPTDLRLTNQGSLAISAVEPEGLDVCRAGRRFYGGGQGSATGRAPVASIPTTAAAFLLWNGEAQGGRCYSIEQITIAQISGTAAVGGVILAALTTQVIAAPTAASNYPSSSASKGGLSTKAVWADNVTLGATPTWAMLLGNGNPATTTNGGSTVDVKGRFLVQPGYALALHYLSGTGTSPLFVASVVWSEFEVEVE